MIPSAQIDILRIQNQKFGLHYFLIFQNEKHFKLFLQSIDV